MRLKWYADLPWRWLRQLAADLFVVAWLVFWVWLAVTAHQHILRAAAPGTGLVNAGNGLRGTFQDAAKGASGVPLIGHQLSSALGSGSAVGSRLVDAGNGEIDLVHQLALWTAVALAVGPLLLIVAVWLPVRLRYAVEAGAVARLARTGVSREVLALRALAGLSPGRLLRLGPGLVAGWRGGDQEATDSLARAECARLGVRMG